MADSVPNELPAGTPGEARFTEMTFEEMYAALRRIARAAMRGEGSSHTLQPTALVHEYLLSLPDGFQADPSENVTIVRVAGWRMRRMLIDHARRRSRRRNRVPLEAVDAEGKAVMFPDIEVLDSVLKELENAGDPGNPGDQQAHREMAAYIEMRFFCGLTHQEIATALGLSIPTVERRWRDARAWLNKRLARPSDVQRPGAPG